MNLVDSSKLKFLAVTAYDKIMCLQKLLITVQLYVVPFFCSMLAMLEARASLRRLWSSGKPEEIAKKFNSSTWRRTSRCQSSTTKTVRMSWRKFFEKLTTRLFDWLTVPRSRWFVAHDLDQQEPGGFLCPVPAARVQARGPVRHGRDGGERTGARSRCGQSGG